MWEIRIIFTYGVGISLYILFWYIKKNDVPLYFRKKQYVGRNKSKLRYTESVTNDINISYLKFKFIVQK